MFGPSLTGPVADLRDAYLESAARAEGYVEFGTTDFIEPLDIMLGDLVHRANLTRLGHLVSRYYLKQLLRMRLKIQRAGPTMAGRIKRPIFILGLPRTGTTLLHELLSQHDALRAPTFHESHRYDDPNRWDIISRGLTHAQLAAVDVMAPTFKRVHELRAHGPHECVSIQAYAFRSMQFHVAFRLPHYNQWMMSQCDWQPAYRIHAQYLSQLTRNQERWVLKAPGHMLGLGALIRQYPDAVFIQTHRDPLEVIPSMASLTLSLRRMAARILDREEIGRDVNELWHRGIYGVIEAREADPALDSRFIDIQYQDFLSDPISTLRDIARFADLTWTATHSESARKHIADHPKHRHGRHQYTLEQFGLNKSELSEQYRAYQRAHLPDRS